MKQVTFILTLVLLTSCKGSKNISGTSSPIECEGKLIQINQIDINEPYHMCSGYIIDLELSERIPFASVVITNKFREYKTHTDEFGNFKIEDIVAGKYQFKVILYGYCPLVEWVNMKKGKKTAYKIELERDTELD